MTTFCAVIDTALTSLHFVEAGVWLDLIVLPLTFISPGNELYFFTDIFQVAEP